MTITPVFAEEMPEAEPSSQEQVLEEETVEEETTEEEITEETEQVDYTPAVSLINATESTVTIKVDGAADEYKLHIGEQEITSDPAQEVTFNDLAGGTEYEIIAEAYKDGEKVGELISKFSTKYEKCYAPKIKIAATDVHSITINLAPEDKGHAPDEYQIAYSESKDMAGAKTVTLDASESTYKIGDLKADTTYYIQASSMYTKDGKTICSKNTSNMSIKTAKRPRCGSGYVTGYVTSCSTAEFEAYKLNISKRDQFPEEAYIKYSANENMKDCKIKYYTPSKTKKQTIKISGLKAGTKYYFAYGFYYTDGKEKVYSEEKTESLTTAVTAIDKKAILKAMQNAPYGEDSDYEFPEPVYAQWKDINNVIQEIYREYPELKVKFISCNLYSSHGVYKGISLRKGAGKAEVQKLTNAINSIVNGAKKQKTAKAKLNYINDRICAITRYSNGSHSADAYGILVLKRGVCAGYADAFNVCANRAGIKCEVVESSTHAWNKVKLNGKWYHIDSCWNDAGSYSNDRYFLMSADQIQKYNHHYYLRGRKKEEGGWVFYEQGSKIKNAWRSDSNGTFYIGSDGKLKQYTFYVGGKRYYATSACNIIKNRFMDFKSSGTKVYFGSDGAAKTGFFYVGGKRYYANKDGSLKRYGFYIGSKRYYAYGTYVLARNRFVHFKNENYDVYFDNNGAAKTGFFTVGKKTYYGTSKTGEIKKYTFYVGKNRYYANSKGEVQKNRFIQFKGYKIYYDKNGVAKTGTFYVNGKRYKADSKGVIR